MAISKERLEELIKENATVYWLAGKMVLNIHLDSSYYVSDANILCHKRSEDEKNCVEHIEDLYETQKQATWALNHHATRTEELDLPIWENIVEHKDDDIYKIASFRRKNGMLYNLLFKRGDLMLWGVQELMNVWIDLATEENYTKLCDLCLKLFEGEEK